MKIGYICSDIDIPLFGDEGCSIHVRDFTDALVAIGHDSFIISASLGENPPIPTRAKVYQVQPSGLDATAWGLVEEEPLIQDNHLERDLRSVIYNAWLSREGASIMETERPDFLCERYSLFGWGGIELAQRYGVPLILEVNDPLCREQAGYEKFTLTTTAERMEKEIICRADGIVAVSEWVKDWAISLGADKHNVHVIPNGVKGDLFVAQVSGQKVREQYGLTGKRVVGFLGSFQPWHDVRGLLKAFAGLYGKDPDLRLFLVGNGDGRSSLQQTISSLGLSSAVIFTGNVAHDNIPEYLDAMDVAVAPYDWSDDFYGSPLKLLEYMAAGRPTVAAAIGQIEKVIEHGQTGWLYESGNQEKLTEGLAALLYNRELAAAIGQAARQKILSDFTWQAIARRVVGIGNELLGSFAQKAKVRAAKATGGRT
jgi:glycosyltransferase involved in cell wall biosynthesis